MKSNSSLQYQVKCPKTLTWDRMCELFLLVQEVWNTTLNNVVLWFEDELGTEGKFPDGIYEIGVPQKEGGKRYGSATEKIADVYNINIPGISELIRLMNKNNQTGYLKNYSQSLVLLIRRAYEVAHCESQFGHRQSVIEAFWPVVYSYFFACRKGEEAVQALLANNDAVFTFKGYAELMRIEGRTETNIQDRLVSIRKIFQKVEKRQEQTEERARTIAKTSFIIMAEGSSGQVEGHVIRSDDNMIGHIYLKTWLEAMVLVVHSRSGHMALFFREGQDPSVLLKVLQDEEPGKWFDGRHYNKPIILNSSASKDAAPTAHTETTIINRIQRYYRYRLVEQNHQSYRKRNRKR
ncbi:MAG: hypothetical protein V1838_03945 [Patescibacteria group bacterium]